MIVQTTIVKAAIVLAATLNPSHPSESYNNGKKGFRLPFLPQRQAPLSEVADLPTLDVAAAASKDQRKLCVALGIRGGEQVEKKQSFLQRHPFWSACVITTINALGADLLTQLVFESNPWNPKRSAVFAAFGFLYQGMNFNFYNFSLQPRISCVV